MVDGPEKSVFVVAANTSMLGSPNGPPVPRGVSLTHFATVADCRATLSEAPCHLLIISLNGNTVEGLQFLGDAKPALIRIHHL